ncbi:hypothetical protein GSI_09964 [Ganoderma sinense ZZ0214-1]|uniref:Uncharacterized protein n=1 Tax=Ganoderma sinense ZZ0214-1 TaxID=1077348 RepID=A0A2G8S2C6_9APHY|nr:hypothetical protein GSI_09964 [Ganoderma sinense ZZ0214-1]
MTRSFLSRRRSVRTDASASLESDIVATLSPSNTLPHGSSIPDLDEDVMETICAFTEDIHDLLSVSLACSTMWRIAIRQLLRTQTIRLNSRKVICGFREFILNQKPTRAQHIRSLAILHDAWSPGHRLFHLNDMGDQLMDILDCAVNLDTLDLSLDNFEFNRADRYARLSSAIASMRALRHLSLSDPYLLGTIIVLNALSSPPVTICIRSTTIFPVPFLIPPPSPLKIATALDRFQSTPSVLTSLHFDFISLNEDTFALPQIRSVRSVFVSEVRGGPRLDVLLHLFPNLDGTLRLRLTPQERFRLFDNELRLAQIRDDNRRTQEVHHWARLDMLDCEAMTAFAFALQCPVRRLTISRFDSRVLADMRPQHLVVTSIRLPQDLTLINDCTRTPSLCAGSQASHVVLVLAHEAQDHRAENVDFMPRRSENVVFKSAVQALAFFPHVTHARLVFECYKDHPFRDELDEYDLVHQMRECASISPDGRILAACPSLRCLVVTAAGRDESQAGIPSHGGWFATRAWRVVEGNDRQRTTGRAEPASRRLEELSDYAARSIIEAEDLGLPDELEQNLASYGM